MTTGRIAAVGRTMSDLARNLSAVAGRAVQEQLGLKLEPARRVVDVFVIDPAKRPAED